MSNQYFNFSYDPVRQGYDSDTWSTVLGVPVLENNKLTISGATIISLSNILKGEFVFNVNMSEPAAGDVIRFGLIELNKGAFMGFNVTDTDFSANTVYEGNLSNSAITWNTDWSNVDIEFKIKWEAGMVTYYVNNEFKARVSAADILDINNYVSGDPMSLYLTSTGTNPIYLKYIDVKGAQGLI